MPARSPKLSVETAERLAGLGRRIRQQRKQLGVSATVAAEAAGMSRITWFRIEKGEPSVTMGAWASAANAVGLFLRLSEDRATLEQDSDWIPARIPLANYPELQKLAWHVRGTGYLSAREALDIYEANQRHLDQNALTAQEAQLIESLKTAFEPEHWEP